MKNDCQWAFISVSQYRESIVTSAILVSWYLVSRYIVVSWVSPNTIYNSTLRTAIARARLPHDNRQWTCKRIPAYSIRTEISDSQFPSKCKYYFTNSLVVNVWNSYVVSGQSVGLNCFKNRLDNNSVSGDWFSCWDLRNRKQQWSYSLIALDKNNCNLYMSRYGHCLIPYFLYVYVYVHSGPRSWMGGINNTFNQHTPLPAIVCFRFWEHVYSPENRQRSKKNMLIPGSLPGAAGASFWSLVFSVWTCSLVQPIGLVDYNYVFKEVHLTSTFLKEILEAVYRRCIDVLLGKIIPSIYNPVICQFRSRSSMNGLGWVLRSPSGSVLVWLHVTVKLRKEYC